MSPRALMAVGLAMAAIGVMALAVLASRARDEARFWECNAARRASRVAFLEATRHADTWYFENGGGTLLWWDPEPGASPEDSDVTVVLKDPRPYDGCWLDGETYRTAGHLAPPRVVVR